MKLLHLDSSILGEGSASRALSAAIVARLQAVHPGLEVVYRDLAADPVPHIDVATWSQGDSPELQAFLDADVVVIGAGLYNFSVPSQLKAWIDRIAVRGKTFSYGENGPVGLIKDKRVIVALARGGFYGAESPFAAYEHGESLLRALFGFIGATPEFILAEGMGRGEEVRSKSLAAALAQAEQLA